MAAIGQMIHWRDGRLCRGHRLSGYSIVSCYPWMWRVRSPDGTLSEIVNRTRAKDAAMAMLDRDLRCGDSHSAAC